MEEKFLEIRAKMKGYQERSAGKKRVHYPESFRREVLEFLETEKLSVLKFCKKTGFSHSTVSYWRKVSSSKVSKPVKKESLFKPVSLREERKRTVLVLSGLSLEEMVQLVGEL